MCALTSQNYSLAFEKGTQEHELYELGFHSSASEHLFISSADEALKVALTKKKKKLRKTKHSIKEEIKPYDFNEDEEMTEEYFRELLEPKYQSAFTDFATGKLEITEKDEELLQDWMDNSPLPSKGPGVEELRKKFYNPASWSPMKRYSRITSNIQSSLHRVYGKDHVALFFSDFEAYLEDFIMKKRDRAVVVFKDGYQRFLAHGIINYYLLHSKSIDHEGERITVIQSSSRLKRLQSYAMKHPRKGKKLIIPQLKLYHFLAMIYSHSPQDIDRRVINGETFHIPEKITLSQLNVSDMESGFDSASRRSTRKKKSKVLRKRKPRVDSN